MIFVWASYDVLDFWIDFSPFSARGNIPMIGPRHADRTCVLDVPICNCPRAICSQTGDSKRHLSPRGTAKNSADYHTSTCVSMENAWLPHMDRGPQSETGRSPNPRINPTKDVSHEPSIPRRANWTVQTKPVTCRSTIHASTPLRSAVCLLK
jgi:hypothetical protein